MGRVVDGKYEIEEILGVGGMGMVFKARRTLIGDHVALKVLFPRFLESKLQRQLFRDEAVAAARLSHPNCVTVFDADISAETDVAYIAMELLQGRPFKALLKDRAPMPVDEVLPLVVQICDGLAAAHAARVVHRDLKPDNIFLQTLSGGRTRVKLVDFGIAAMLDADPRDEQRRLLGTLRYMAPEQARNEAVDARADLYALGVVIYEALTRKRATGKTLSAVIHDPVVPPNEFLEEAKRLPTPLEALLMALLEKHPDDRPASALAVKESVLALTRATGLTTAPPRVPAPISLQGLMPPKGMSIPSSPPGPIAPEAIAVPPEPTPAAAPDLGAAPSKKILLVGLAIALAVGVVGALVFSRFGG